MARVCKDSHRTAPLGTELAALESARQLVSRQQRKAAAAPLRLTNSHARCNQQAGAVAQPAVAAGQKVTT